MLLRIILVTGSFAAMSLLATVFLPTQSAATASHTIHGPVACEPTAPADTADDVKEANAQRSNR